MVSIIFNCSSLQEKNFRFLIYLEENTVPKNGSQILFDIYSPCTERGDDRTRKNNHNQLPKVSRFHLFQTKLIRFIFRDRL
jgi:hypothetical protein